VARFLAVYYNDTKNEPVRIRGPAPARNKEAILKTHSFDRGGSKKDD
jgi:hypothetical protein